MQSVYKHIHQVLTTDLYNYLLYVVILSINWTFVSSITELESTQYRIDCHTTDVNPTTDVTSSGQKKEFIYHRVGLHFRLRRFVEMWADNYQILVRRRRSVAGLE